VGVRVCVSDHAVAIKFKMIPFIPLLLKLRPILGIVEQTATGFASIERDSDRLAYNNNNYNKNNLSSTQ
jgi:hypothetical protein